MLPKEQNLSGNEFHPIRTILLDAGYHRAQLSELSEFDIVIGGLCWILQKYLQEDAKVQFFNEDSTKENSVGVERYLPVNPNCKKTPSSTSSHAITSKEILFHEKLSIGQKIIISEKIVHFLKKQGNPDYQCCGCK